ncbi:HAD-like domain-containing protein [Fusarium oxysporum]|nr:HAD-like domain-containing protein [Fusarium oxysporum]
MLSVKPAVAVEAHLPLPKSCLSVESTYAYDYIIFYRWLSPDLYERGRVMARLVAEMIEKKSRRLWLDQHQMTRSTEAGEVTKRISNTFLSVSQIIILAAPGDWDRFTNPDDIHRWEWEMSLRSDKQVWLLQYGLPDNGQALSRAQLAEGLENIDVLPSITSNITMSMLDSMTPGSSHHASLDQPITSQTGAMSKESHAIQTAFRAGKEYVVPWGSQEEQRIEQAMQDLGSYLSDLDHSLSYEGTDKKVVWRKSCWFASQGIGHPFLDSETDIAKFDGDLKDGLTGLQALHDARTRESAHCLKSALDSALVTTSMAVGIDPDLVQRCTVRYRAIKYTPHAGAPGGIGLHPDGNLLSALITNGPGLRVYDLDGTVRFPGHRGTIMMGGSTLYRWANEFIPTFHDVDISGNEVKVSIVAFFNFPDMETIPRTLRAEGVNFFHDIRRIKEDDKLPSGELSALWDVIIKNHQLSLPPKSFSIMSQPTKIKAVFFDFMGTCLDWHRSVVQALPPAIPEAEASKLALEWRRRYFIANSERLAQKLEPEDIDDTLIRVLDNVLEDSPEHKRHFDAPIKEQLITAWHSQPAWPEVRKAIQSIRDDLGLEVFVHANGTTRLQLDLTRFAGLNFNMLFSSQLLGTYKPDLEAYNKALRLVKLKPEEVVLVAAHAYDLRGAQNVGIKTIYIHRWTDDVDEDMEKVKEEFGVFLEGMEELPATIERMKS